MLILYILNFEYIHNFDHILGSHPIPDVISIVQNEHLSLLNVIIDLDIELETKTNHKEYQEILWLHLI